MTLRLLALVLLAHVPEPLVAQETYGFVARLGRDTASIERITHTAGRVVSDLVEQAPRVIRRHWEATLAPDGSIRQWVMDMSIANPAPNRPAAYIYVVDFAADSVQDGAELIINRQSKQWGTQYDSTRDLGRAPLVTRALPQPIDTFAIRVEHDGGGGGGGTLVFEWDRFRWTAPITAAPAPTGSLGRAFNRSVSAVMDGGRSVLRFDQRSGAGILWFPEVHMDHGVIEFDARGQDVQQRSFLGVTFRQVDDSTWDSVWLRPFNFRGIDSAHHAHALQYASYPAHPWQQLRQDHPGRYEAALDPIPDPAGWVHVWIEIARPEVWVFINGVLTLRAPELSGRTGGSVGLWVGDCSPGDFANVLVTPRGGRPVLIGLPASITTIRPDGDAGGTPAPGGCT